MINRHAASILLLASAILLASGKVAASHHVTSCFEQAGARYRISPLLLWSIAKTESNFNPRAINRSNANKTYDIGMMQINSAWLSTLQRYNISEQDLYDACTSIHVGAWILAQNVARHGYTWKAVGAYNAVTPSKQAKYAAKVLKTANEVAGSAPAVPSVREAPRIRVQG
ncbi:MAG: lytic transglycosylase domain-containing protein [Rhodocyclaceae bacterium]|nr:lytic transglycosylase domain-containing protein [Opitutaceae bacterium]MCL4682653.1 lytic transglycosylase domain-containing protein [Rhodocyclaceae bacterium]